MSGLLSEQGIINRVFNPDNNTLRVETETAVVLSGVTLNVAGSVNQGSRGPEPWPVSGTVVVSNTVNTAITNTPAVTISNNPTVIQGNSTGAPWIVSGTVVATVGSSITSLPLPSGAATAALQTSGITSLASIDGKFSALPTPVNKYVTFSGIQTNATVWTPASGKGINLEILKLSVDSSNVVEFNGATTGTIDRGDYVAQGGFVMNAPDRDTPIVRMVANEVLRVSSSGGNIYVTASGYER